MLTASFAYLLDEKQINCKERCQELSNGEEWIELDGRQFRMDTRLEYLFSFSCWNQFGGCKRKRDISTHMSSEFADKYLINPVVRLGVECVEDVVQGLRRVCGYVQLCSAFFY